MERYTEYHGTDQYRATIMIATTINAAVTERSRSSVFDLGFAAMSGGGMAYVGGCSSPANQPTARDFIGSNAITICSRCLKAARRACTSGSFSLKGISTPIRRTFPGCCARAAYGHAAKKGDELASSHGTPPRTRFAPSYSSFDRYRVPNGTYGCRTLSSPMSA
jgi:hypothetical protein